MKILIHRTTVEKQTTLHIIKNLKKKDVREEEKL